MVAMRYMYICAMCSECPNQNVPCSYVIPCVFNPKLTHKGLKKLNPTGLKVIAFFKELREFNPI